MNFFFGIKNSFLSSKLTIPKFQNFGKYSDDNFIYEAYPEKNLWIINKLECNQDKSFFFLDDNIIDNKKIFFLAKEREIKKLKKPIKLLQDLSKFTNTTPVAFRANLKIYNDRGGFSSYQSEYPYIMATKHGSILSPISMLLNKNADKNFIFFKNIYFKPATNKSKLFLINLSTNKIINEVEIKQNFLNEIEIKNKYISEEVYIFTEKFLGIPLYVSVKNNHLSFEHTHPPHHYILSSDRYKIISNIKNEIKKIINA